MKNNKNQYNLISISHFFYPRVGGLENMAYGIVKNLSEKGFKSIAIFGNDRNLKFESEGFTWKSFNCIKIFNRSYPILGFGFFFFTLNTIKDNPNAQILIHDRHLTSSILGAFASRILGRKYIVISHTTISNYFNNRFLAFVSRIFENVFSSYVLAGADKIICVSISNKEYIVRNFKINPNKAVVIYNCFRDQNILKFKGAKKQKIVIFNTKLIPVKDPDTTALAFLKIAEKYPEWKFIFSGEGETVLQNITELPENLEFRPKFIQQLELFQMLSETSIYINSSLNEGLSLGVIEAAALGNVTVLSDAPSNKEVATKLNTQHFVFSRRNPADLVQKLETAIQLLEEKGEVINNRMSENAFKSFSSDMIFDEYFNTLNENNVENFLHFNLKRK